MLVKISIKSELEILTGLHIGGNSAFAAIGAVDSPVIRDSVTMEPIIPGSSLKGKIRFLLAKKYNQKNATKHSDDDEKILKLFGSANSQDKKAIQCRLLFNDIYPINEDELKNRGVESLTEVKFENNIDRITAKAMPRQIERVVRGTKFEFAVIYSLFVDETDESSNIENEIDEDLNLFYDGIKLLEDDYLGGSGTRGYGRVKFKNFDIKVLSCVDSDKENIENKAKEIFKGQNEI